MPIANLVTATLTLALQVPVDHPLPADERAALTKQFEKDADELTERIKDDAKNVGLYSRRGDTFFFLGQFDKALADYQKMVELNPKVENSHWRRGIAAFYAKDYKLAAHQFEIYHSFDDVDRENGIWRYLSQMRAYGKEKAREGLLKYKKDDREPFPDVYRLFSGEITPDEILKRIEAAKIDDIEREKRRFYAELYIGLNYGVEKKPKKARDHLRKAVANTWGPRGGFGPTYMWHVGRVHFETLLKSPASDK